MITLIKDTITDQEFRSEPSQELLIINRCTLGVLLSLKIPLYLVKPGFICYLLSLNVIAMWGLSNLSIVIRGASLSHLTLNIEDMVASESAS